jgi:protein TonB
MAVKKKDGANLRKRYPIYVEVGMIVALLLLIGAFRFNMGSAPKKTFTVQEQSTVDVKEVEQTTQQKQPPPPPRPPVPIEKPDDQVLEDENLDFDRTLDLNESLQKTTNNDAPPPEPKGDQEKEVVDFAVIEDKPEMKGGQEALYDALNYPSFAKNANIEGTVFLQFTVTTKGNVKDVKALRSPHEALTEAAIAAMKKMTFSPGKQRKEPVEVRMSQPIRFKLN